MQPACVVVVLALLVAPLVATAQPAPQPASLDEPCFVPHDERWTDQEKFVWERICIGETADFNAAPSYGGELDREKPEAWPQNRVLRPAFLRMILLKERYRSALTPRGVVIVGARFVEPIDLEGAELQNPLELLQSVLEEGANLQQLRSKYPIILAGSNVARLDASGLHLESDLVLQEAKVAEVDLSGARVSGQLSLIGSKVTRLLNMNGLRVDSFLFMQGKAELAEVNLVGAHIGRELSLADSKVTGLLNMNGLRVDGPLSADEAEFAKVNLVGAHIGGELNLEGSKVTDLLNVNALRVDSVLLMRNKAELAEVNLVGAHLSHLDLNSSKVTGLLDMSGLRVDENLAMGDKAEFAKVNLVGAHIGGDLSLASSKVTGLLDMSRFQVERDLFMGDEAEFADVKLIGSHVGNVDLSNSKVTGLLNMNGFRVDRALFMDDRAELAEVDLVGAHIGSELSLAGSKVTGLLNMNGLRVDRQLGAAKAELAQVNLVGAHIGAALSLAGSKVTGLLEMNGLRVDRGLFMDNKAEFSQVDLSGGAHIGRELNLVGSKVTGLLDMNGLRVDGGLFMREGAEFAQVDLRGAHVDNVDLRSSEVGGNFYCFAMEVEQEIRMRNAKFDGKIDCAIAKIKGNLYLDGSQFQQNVDLSGTSIGVALSLASAQWSDGVALDLRNANVGTIPDLAAGWPPKLHLDGLTYRSVGEINKFENWLNKIERYAPQPYEQLASVVERRGHGTLATSIRYSGRERERAELTGTADSAWLTILKYVIGYGYYPGRAIYWAIGLVMIGAIVLRISGEGLAHQMPFGLTYSFDMLLPIIRLRESDYKFDLQGWARYYFYGHKILGWVLAFFLVAAISGITK